MTMGYRLLADLTLFLHLLFILYVLFGALLCLHYLRWATLHLPALLWGIWVEWSGAICPLTPVENYFRHRAFESGYQGGFIDHYLVQIVYPQGLTRTAQWILAAGLLFLNVCIYLYVIRRHKKYHQAVDE